MAQMGILGEGCRTSLAQQIEDFLAAYNSISF